MLKCILLVGTFSLPREEWGSNWACVNKTWKQIKNKVLFAEHAKHEKLCNAIQHKTTQGAKVKLESVSDKAH
jgi:hypothetical protein